MKDNWFGKLISWFSIGIISIIILAFICGFITAAIVMGLWNWLAPIFWEGSPILGFWETWGAMILISIIIGLFRRK